jgi:hypothetical protein
MNLLCCWGERKIPPSAKKKLEDFNNVGILSSLSLSANIGEGKKFGDGKHFFTEQHAECVLVMPVDVLFSRKYMMIFYLFLFPAFFMFFDLLIKLLDEDSFRVAHRR